MAKPKFLKRIRSRIQEARVAGEERRASAKARRSQVRLAKLTTRRKQKVKEAIEIEKIKSASRIERARTRPRPTTKDMFKSTGKTILSKLDAITKPPSPRKRAKRKSKAKEIHFEKAFDFGF